MSQIASYKKKNQPVKVYIRPRPLSEHELESRSPNVIQHTTKQELVIRSGLHEKRYSFDQVFDEETSQKEVYASVVDPLINSIISGYSCTVFAYGQTGTGKTYTMIGNKNDASIGLIPRSAAHLFDELNRNQYEYTVRVSFIEIYNEEVRDLLSDSSIQLKMFEDPENKGCVCLKNLKEATVFNLQEVRDWLNVGLIERQTAATNMNRQSSRSHSIFILSVLTRQLTVDGDELIKTGKLYLVDLAGSENIGKSGSVEIRAREAGNINRSLLTLGKVIKSLAQKAQHVPYRDSKLTRILQDSLGGKTKTCMIATISPAASVFEETISTLEYAQVARNVSNCPQINENRKQANILKELKGEIGRLRKELAIARAGEGFYMSKDNYEKLCEDLETSQNEVVANRKRLSELIKTNQTLENEIVVKSNQLESLTLSYNSIKRELDENKSLAKRNEYILNYLNKREEELKLTADHLLKMCEISTKHEALFSRKYENQCEATLQNAMVAKKAYSVFGDSLEILRGATQGYCEIQKSSFGEIQKNVDNLKHISQKILTRLTTIQSSDNDCVISEEFSISDFEKQLTSLLNSTIFEAQKIAILELEEYNRTKIEEMESMTHRCVNSMKQLLNDYTLSANDIMKNHSSLIGQLKNVTEAKENWANTIEDYASKFIRKLMEDVRDQKRRNTKNLVREVDGIKNEFSSEAENRIYNILTNLESAQNSQRGYEDVVKRISNQTLQRFKTELDENVKLVTHLGDTPVKCTYNYPKKIEERLPATALFREFEDGDF